MWSNAEPRRATSLRLTEAQAPVQSPPAIASAVRTMRSSGRKTARVRAGPQHAYAVPL